MIGRLRTSVWEKNGQTLERLGLEADTVGHDLSKGTAMFRRGRSARPTAPSDRRTTSLTGAEERHKRRGRRRPSSR